MTTIAGVKENFIRQSQYCLKLGSPLYAALLPELSEFLDESELIYKALASWSGDPHDDAIALRFIAALNYLVITEQAPQIKPIFSSRVYGASDINKERLRQSLREHAEFIVDYLNLPPQTNEVGRCCVLLPGLLEIATRFGPKMDLFEVGASAGLNLFFDRYHYKTGEWGWGNEDAQVQFDILWRGAAPKFSSIQVMSRNACDKSPVDLRTDHTRLLSYVWPDQLRRVARLKAAIEETRDSMVLIDRANASDWLDALAESEAPRHTRVLYHSIIWQYFSDSEQERFRRALDRLAETASTESPVVWLRLEPAADKSCAELRMKSWPGGVDYRLAESSFHGDWVNWLGAQV